MKIPIIQLNKSWSAMKKSDKNTTSKRKKAIGDQHYCFGVKLLYLSCSVAASRARHISSNGKATASRHNNW